MGHLSLLLASLLLFGTDIAKCQNPGDSCQGGAGTWKGWISVDTNAGEGDFETLDSINKVFPNFCNNPLEIISKPVPGSQTVTTHKDVGLICQNSLNQPDGCQDYSIMVCCASGTAANFDEDFTGFDCLLAKRLSEVGTFNAADDLPCTNPCDESEEPVTNETICLGRSYCHWDGAACHGKRWPVTDVGGDDDASAFAIQDTSVSGRLFGLGGQPNPQWPPTNPQPFPPNFPCPRPPPGFPRNCNINPYSPGLDLITPPINIPYCYRVPCSTSDPSLEISRVRCHNQPGCYFDQQLYNLRRLGGPSLLTGVPVCHEVIRHKNFAKKAIELANKANVPWLGIYTNCLLQQYPDIFHDATCDAIKIYLHFHVPVKHLGWQGITAKECAYLGGCFFKGKCYYPTVFNQIQLRAGEDPHRNPTTPTGRDIYGQPQCLPFNPEADPAGILNGYHQCRLAGCVMDPYYNGDRIRQYLCEIAKSDVVPARLKRRFWQMVRQGHIGADNWQKILNQLISNVCPNNPFSNLGLFDNVLPGCYNPFSLNPIGIPIPSLNPFSLNLGDVTTTTQAPPSGRGYPFPGPPNPGQPFPGQPFPGQPFPGQPFPGQPFPGQPFPGQPFPGQPNPGPQFPGIPFPGYPQPQCPYKPYRAHGVQPLQGRFDGCCEHHRCYIPRAFARSQSAGVASYWTEYGEWEDCSVSCGGGTKKRTRRCVGSDGNDQSNCEGDSEQIAACGDEACPYWGSYGPWTECTASCGGGTQTSTQQCEPSGTGCSGSPGVQTQSCNTCPCPVYSNEGGWTPCSVTRGCGIQTKTKTCTGYCEPPQCASSSITMTESKGCRVLCSVVTNETPCQRVPGSFFAICQKTITRSCPCSGTCEPCGSFVAEQKVWCTCPFQGKK